MKVHVAGKIWSVEGLEMRECRIGGSAYRGKILPHALLRTEKRKQLLSYPVALIATDHWPTRNDALRLRTEANSKGATQR